MSTIRNIVAISGSLKRGSSNTALLNIISGMCADLTTFTLYLGLSELPHFNPDLEETPIDTVVDFRSIIQKSDAVIICTPEYAFGIPGSLKNALDWTVSSGDFYNKPVGTISASPMPSGADKAHAALRLTLTAMGSQFIEGAMLTIPAMRNKVDKDGNLTDEKLRKDLQGFIKAVESYSNIK
jgi:chromate reductase